MLTRRNFLKAVTFGAAAFSVGTTIAAAEAVLDAKTLKFKLEAKGDIENKFIDTVVALRDNKVIPDRFINGCYKYAMRKQENRFAYFSKSLTVLCKDAGIVIPVPSSR